MIPSINAQASLDKMPRDKQADLLRAWYQWRRILQEGTDLEMERFFLEIDEETKNWLVLAHG